MYSNNRKSWRDSLNYLIIYYEGILSARSTLYIDIPEEIDPGSTMLLHTHTDQYYTDLLFSDGH